MELRRKGVSTVAVAVVVVVVVAIAGAAFLLQSSGGSTTSSTTKTTPPSTSSTSLCCTSSTVSSSYSVDMSMQPDVPLASSDVVANYTLQVTVLGSLNSPLTVTASGPAGVTIQVGAGQVQPGMEAGSYTLSFVVGGSVAPGSYAFNVSASSGGQTNSQKFSLEVVKYLVVTVGASYLPDKISVPVGSTVYWMRLNGAISQYDSGSHNVVFNSLSVTSPTLAQYDSWSYKFTQAGNFTYYCSFHTYMTGTVSVG